MKAGRPRQFDRQQAVITAMHLFWQNGYDATSLSQLKAAIGGGITAPSFYAAFGSKEALFREAVECYLQTHAQVTETLWDESLGPRLALESAFRGSLRMQYEEGHPRGCMVALGVMSCIAEQDRAILAPLTASRQRTRDGIQFCIDRGIRSGELQNSPATQALTTVFDSFMLGISTLARDNAPKQSIEQAIEQILTLWDAARLTDKASE
ncbi:TetR family transcriptional regulator [Tatumella morbirosei]|uniref:TetR family transcriptional regulator n=1 Tax=Tatumella morbirosei TaxID=642227 RepID=A0A095TUD6_9GAMM|nr:TetR/AcrR family transcriptional regulator [Tatumella morbirosei]KGD80164.1 TetR family transcriptional regulator [Tatumella morbirosei]